MATKCSVQVRDSERCYWFSREVWERPGWPEDKSLLSELFALWSQAEVEGSRDGYAPPKVTQHTKEL